MQQECASTCLKTENRDGLLPARLALLLKYSIAIPKKDDLNRFNEVIEPMMGQLKALCFANRKLAAARDTLLPKRMSGKLEAAV